MGDIVDGQNPTNYQWPTAAWDVDATNIQIPTEELANQTMTAAAVPPTHFGPYQNGNAGTRLIGVRWTMYVAPQLIPFLINMEDVRPAMDAFMCVAPQVQG
jgi:acyl-homoserine lactone acylase PvdQ